MRSESALIVQVTVQEDGDHFYASSSDVPGLHVCGNTREEACESAVAGIKFLFKHNKGVDVELVPVAHDMDTFPRADKTCDRFVALAS